jgi:hypothetical protein
VDTGSFHSRRGKFSTINPQDFPVIAHRFCLQAVRLCKRPRIADVVKIAFTLASDRSLRRRLILTI